MHAMELDILVSTSGTSIFYKPCNTARAFTFVVGVTVTCDALEGGQEKETVVFWLVVGRDFASFYYKKTVSLKKQGDAYCIIKL